MLTCGRVNEDHSAINKCRMCMHSAYCETRMIMLIITVYINDVVSDDYDNDDYIK